MYVPICFKKSSMDEYKQMDQQKNMTWTWLVTLVFIS